MRGWHEFVARLGEPVPGGVPMLGLILGVVTLLVALLWFFWPSWLPAGRRRAAGGGEGGRGGRRWRRWRRRDRAGAEGRPRWRLRWSWRWSWPWRRRRSAAPEPAEPLPGDLLPDLPATTLALTADQLATQGRYREAVRERLRAIVRELVERQLIEHQPGWTVTELAAVAGRAVPAGGEPLGAAAELFSGIWYGDRPAGAAEDAAMRGYATAVRAALGGAAGAAAAAAGAAPPPPTTAGPGAGEVGGG